MDKEKEIKEAKAAAIEVLLRLDKAVKSLDDASSMSAWDMLGGGSFFSIIKRKHIQGANLSIKEAGIYLKSLNKELGDIGMRLPKEMSDTMSDNVMDIYFDNIFTDIRVASEIREKLDELKSFRESIENLIIKLDAELDIIKEC
ncbi:hypothetical protein [uncultured Fenollaria sp.]|uniref:hypothetical protein n=1 Tax=uncultured Fenollaria sp. TaxID=1686315 RepID=UPI0025F18001|nr:hypothetical protein [uncultured Fenollaria sp.]